MIIFCFYLYFKCLSLTLSLSSRLLHDLLTHSACDIKLVPLSLFRSHELYQAYTCFSFLTHIFTWVSEYFVLQFYPPVKGTSLSWRVKFGTPLSHVHHDVPWFWNLVRALSCECMNTRFWWCQSRIKQGCFNKHSKVKHCFKINTRLLQ